ncbi:MAG: hypothetical protein ACPGVO_00030 [Spirulinaceae cyanobacterium]
MQARLGRFADAAGTSRSELLENLLRRLTVSEVLAVLAQQEGHDNC